MKLVNILIIMFLFGCQGGSIQSVQEYLPQEHTFKSGQLSPKVFDSPQNLSHWTGSWSWENNHSGRLLEIGAENEREFEFILSVYSGAHVGQIEGVAQKQGGSMATFTDSVGCEVAFLLREERIQTEAQEACRYYAGLGTISFTGEYVQGGQKEELTFSSLGFLPPHIDIKLKEVTGKAYDTFVSHLQLISEEVNKDELDATVIHGFVRGLATLMEGSIMYTEAGDIWAAYLDNGKLFYYTNVPEYKEKLPKTFLLKYQKPNVMYKTRDTNN